MNFVYKLTKKIRRPKNGAADLGQFAFKLAGHIYFGSHNEKPFLLQTATASALSKKLEFSSSTLLKIILWGPWKLQLEYLAVSPGLDHMPLLLQAAPAYSFASCL